MGSSDGIDIYELDSVWQKELIYDLKLAIRCSDGSEGLWHYHMMLPVESY